MLRPVLRELKHGTADLHEEAECYVRILDEDATLDDYARYLRAMHAFHAPIEAVFATHADLCEAGFDPGLRCVKAQWMRDDLRALGDRFVAQPCAELPNASTLARAIGIAYVLEGSTLGGRFILSKLPPAIAAVRGIATRFLDGYGKDTGVLWRAFGDLACREITTPIEEASAVHAARETFSHLISWLATFEERRPRAFAEAS